MRSLIGLELLEKMDLHPGDYMPQYFGLHKYVAVIGAAGDWTVYTGPDAWTFEDIRRIGDKIDPDDAKKIYPDLAGLRLTYRR